MEELRIKCPSCGIILDVRNSKNEAVKRIVCPNCKKQLAVTFRDERQPAQFVDIKMIQLADGSTKTIVRALTDEHIIKVNGERLAKDDEVVLAIGDSLEIDDKTGVFTKDGTISYSQTPLSTQKPQQELPPTPTERPRRQWPIYAALTVILFIAFAVWQLSPRQVDTQETTPSEISDTVAEITPVKEVSKKREVRPKQEKQEQPVKQVETREGAKPRLADLSDYALERAALSGDAEAQYLLGKRWVSRSDSINVVKGIKYLKLAAQNGSQEARSALRSVFSNLQHAAVNGNSTAGNILREQR